MMTTLTLLLSVSMLAGVVLTDVLPTSGQQPLHEQVTLRFCYEDKQLLPYYAGNSAEIPEQPGATIEHLRRAASEAGINLELVRMPWLRCLQELEYNNVDALVAAYEESRSHYTRFPAQADGQPDATRAINQLGLCLAYHYDNPLPAKLATQSAITLSRPLGYRPIPFPANTVLVSAYSPEHALELVVSGRVDTTTVLCELNGIEAKEQHLNLIPVLLHYPPLHHSNGYLMLSRGFYQQYPEIAEKLWFALPFTMDKSRYLQYLEFPFQ